MTHLHKHHRKSSVLTCIQGISNLVNLMMLAGAGWILYSKLYINHHEELPEAILAKRKEFLSKKTGTLSYYVDDAAKGRPLLLIHSINAAASAYEMKPLFEANRGKRPVYVLDLPGFGFSQRGVQDYSAQFYVDAIVEFLSEVVKRPADVVALSLGAEFAAQAAKTAPESIRSLALISPTGFRLARPNRGRAMSQKIYPLLSAPLWGQALFDLVATRRSIRYFLSQSFVGPIPEGMVEYAYLTAHQPGAEHAPLNFLSGKLFSPDVVDEVYSQLEIPVLVLYDEDFFAGFDRLPELLEKCNNWRAVRVAPTRGLPHFEQIDETMAALNGFWESK